MHPDVVKHLKIELATCASIVLNARWYGWMASGPHFRDHRLRFQEIARKAEWDMDALGERIRILGGIPIRTPAQVMELSAVTCREASSPPDARTMLQEALDAQQRMVGLVRQGIELSALVGDAGTTSLLSWILRHHEREAWTLGEMLL